MAPARQRRSPLPDRLRTSDRRACGSAADRARWGSRNLSALRGCHQTTRPCPLTAGSPAVGSWFAVPAPDDIRQNTRFFLYDPRGRQARTDSILTPVRSIKPQKSNFSFPSVLGGPMSSSVTRRGWYSQTLKAMSSASFVDGFGPIPRSQRHRTTHRSAADTSLTVTPGSLAVLRCEACRPGQSAGAGHAPEDP
jgi:hypothetical protein